MSKTLDMDGREEAVGMIEKMADGFKKVEVSDPNKLKEFIEGVTGSVMAIMEGINSILYSNDPNAIPLTDFEKASDLPYDTDIPEGIFLTLSYHRYKILVLTLEVFFIYFVKLF